MRIVFMGTPDFAVASLKALIDNGNEIVGVITAPDKPAGRGKVLTASAVKEFALSQGLHIMQPTNLKDPAFVDELKNLQADLQVVVAFRMLPEVVWNMPPKGTINVHASLLPQYRGAAPINWAIINNEPKTGVTTFLLQHEIDTGNVLRSKEVNITPTMNAGELHDKLMTLGAEALAETVNLLAKDEIKSTPQSEIPVSELKSAPKIFKETCKIDWNQEANTIYNLIRGLSPYPAAWSNLQAPDGKNLSIKVYEATINDDELQPGEVKTDGKNHIIVGCKDKSLSLINVHLAGKKRMNVADLLRGFKITNEHLFI